MTSALPPIDWSVTLPETIPFHEARNANVPLYVLGQPGSNNPALVTYGQFAKACRRVPRLLGFTKDFMAEKPVIAILANTDSLIYLTIMLGIILDGGIPFPISHKNTTEAVINLIRISSVKKIIMTTNTIGSLADEVVQTLTALDSTWPSRISEPPRLSQLFPHLAGGGELLEEEDHTPSTSVVKPDLKSTCIYLHSSGSTGLPKAIPISHHEAIKYMRFPTATVFRQENPRIQLACMELTPSHGTAFTFQLCLPLFHGPSITILHPIVDGPSDLPLVANPDMVIDLMERCKSTACFTHPAFIHAWAHNPHHVEVLKNLAFLEYAGGALSSEVGDMLFKSGVKLRLLYGGTEFGAVALCSIRKGDEADWEYIEIAEDAHAHFVPQGDGTYELQFISPDEYPRSITNIPGVNGYTTSDLVRPHPTKNYLWKLVGRIDDVIIHTTGNNTVPAPIEFVIQSSPYVLGVVVFGSGHDKPGVLIEPKESHAIDINNAEQVSNLRDLLWPIVSAANKASPTHSKIHKDMILFTSRLKPLPRTSKWTILTKASLNLYADEINAAFESYALSGTSE